jgi:glycosyltransferase involved in cell wall biosynthesis
MRRGVIGCMVIEKVAIVIPVLNEEAALHRLLAEIAPNFAQWVIVVDNGSTDATAAVAQRSGAIVASEPLRSYGRACLKGFKTACSPGAEMVIFMDGDGSDDPADLPMMLRPMREGRADFVIGSRASERAERGAVPPQARQGNWLVSRLIRLLYGVPPHDIGSFRALRCSLLGALEMREMSYGWPVEMVVKAAWAHYRIVEVPIYYRHRSHGRSKVAGTTAGSMKAAFYMVRISLTWLGSLLGRRTTSTGLTRQAASTTPPSWQRLPHRSRSICVLFHNKGQSVVLACTRPSSGRTSEAISAPSLSAQIRRISAGISL